MNTNGHLHVTPEEDAARVITEEATRELTEYLSKYSKHRRLPEFDRAFGVVLDAVAGELEKMKGEHNV